MTLPTAAASRRLKHRRQVDVRVFDRRVALRERVGGILGCTHITELAQVLPTAVVQGFAGEVLDSDSDERPFQIDRCHALRADGEVVRLHYPRWHRAAATDSEPSRRPE